jgi:hypothetical protein
MSESFKLHIYIYVEEESNLRFIYVCDDNSKTLMEDLTSSTEKIVRNIKIKMKIGQRDESVKDD